MKESGVNPMCARPAPVPCSDLNPPCVPPPPAAHRQARCWPRVGLSSSARWPTPPPSDDHTRADPTPPLHLAGSSTALIDALHVAAGAASALIDSRVVHPVDTLVIPPSPPSSSSWQPSPSSSVAAAPGPLHAHLAAPSTARP
jgi:hypothetical protein